MVGRQRAMTGHQRRLLTALRFSWARVRLRVGRARYVLTGGNLPPGFSWAIVNDRASGDGDLTDTQAGLPQSAWRRARIHADLHHLKLGADQYVPLRRQEL